MQIEEWCRDGVIVKSKSAYASPLVVVKKSKGDLRLCVDYRKLYAKTVRDAYPIPRVDDSLESLEGANICSCFDLKSAYTQVRLDVKHQHKTAFSSPWGLYEFTRMPFGLVNAPATFQRIMSNLFREEIFKFMVCYLDDVVVYSKTYEEHVEHVEIILKRLEKVGLRLNSSKCKLFMREITFLGMNISENGIRTNQEKTRAISEWPRPRNLKELRSFLGVGSYYRKFIKGYSTLVSPLTLLTKSG